MIETLSLFEPLDDALLALLRSLSRQDWSRPTIAGAWTVRDVVAHLLDTPLRRLSFVRDGWPPNADIRSDTDLVAFVNAMNAEGVRTYGRLSPPVLIDLMTFVSAQLRDHLRASAPDDVAAFPVSWAGESTSVHWFDVAREYTERWHHQAQIRLAVGALGPLMTARFYTPLVATFMCVLPHALRAVASREGDRIVVIVDGEGGGTWTVTREGAVWYLDGPARDAGPDPGAMSGRTPPFSSVKRDLRARPATVGPALRARPNPLARVTIPADIAWRLFTKGLVAEDIARQCQTQGDRGIAAAVLAARAIVG